MSQHILIVDDNTFASDIFKRKLEHEGFRVSLCKNGRDCLTQLQQEIPDLVLLDLMMPGIDGFAVLKIARSRKELAKLPIIVFTAKDHPLDRQKAFDLGANECLIKSKSSCNDVVSQIRKSIRSNQATSPTGTYKIAIKEGIFDSNRLAQDYGCNGNLACKACQCSLFIELVPDQSQNNETFLAKFYCPECSKKETFDLHSIKSVPSQVAMQ